MRHGWYIGREKIFYGVVLYKTFGGITDLHTDMSVVHAGNLGTLYRRPWLESLLSYMLESVVLQNYCWTAT